MYYFRAATVECLESIFDAIPHESMQAFLPMIVAHQMCAMTHIKDDIKFDSIKVLISHTVFFLAYPCPLPETCPLIPGVTHPHVHVSSVTVQSCL